MIALPCTDALREARKELLDLGFRNPLIHFRTLSARGIEIEDEISAEILAILLHRGKSMTFLPRTEGDATGTDIVLAQPIEVAQAHARHTDFQLQTPYTSAILQKRLLNTYYAANTTLQEMGVNTLFIALGFLEWYETTESTTPHFAPILLVPVELTRVSAQSRFQVSYTDEDLGENLSLKEKLRIDFAMKWPDLPDAGDLDIDAYLLEIARVIAPWSRWKIHKNRMEIGFFSFGKFLMYKDLEEDRWPDEAKPCTHPLLDALLGAGFVSQGNQTPGNVGLDTLVPYDSTPHVMDADSSQMLALIDVAQGLNLVIEGPPGTGKSQTIINLIAQCLDQGKKVLFVSEKMAALEVVKRRMDVIGLGAPCLELHSNKANKKAVLNELQATLKATKPASSSNGVPIELLEDTRQRLNAHVENLHSPVGTSGRTPFQLLGERMRLKQELKGITLPEVQVEALQAWSAGDFEKRLALVQKIETHLTTSGLPLDHPFWGSECRSMMPATAQQLEQAGKAAIGHFKALWNDANRLGEQLGMAMPARCADVQLILSVSQRVQSAPNLRGVELDATVWANNQKAIQELLKAGINQHKLFDEYQTVFTQEAWRYDAGALRRHVAAHGEKWWRLLIKDFREAQKALERLSPGSRSKKNPEKLRLLDVLIAYRRQLDIVNRGGTIGKSLFGEQWSGVESAWPDLIAITRWTSALFADIYNGDLPEEVLPALRRNLNPHALKETTGRTSLALDQYRSGLATIDRILQLNNSRRFGNPSGLDEQAFTEHVRLIKACSNEADRLREISQLNHLSDELQKLDLGPLLSIAYTWPAGRDHLVQLFRFYRIERLIERAFRERPHLASFDGTAHSSDVHRFRALDEATFALNRDKLAAMHWERLPRHGHSPEKAVLAREFEKKRAHLPIRQLMEKAGSLIQDIKPVFMMSPMSIATYLPPGALTFDLVIFDEASQVRPVDALGAILRGKQIVVVGDSKQLPPTAFFDTLSGDEEVESLTGDLESVLGLFRMKGCPDRMLRWHYRSRHESLIAVSNWWFYDNNLITFPGPDIDRQALGLRYRYVQEGEYDSGGSSTNRKEARCVALAALEHAAKTPDKTLGIAAFSMSQMQAILDELEMLRRRHSETESFFNGHPDEPFFVKNLENIQGDERDVIFISVGYGKGVNGQVRMQFGPLNKDGGERRLNVLITRARERCEVFTNLESGDLDLSRTGARGVEVLKSYLQFAKTGDLQIPGRPGGDSESPFEQAVADALRKRGYLVHHQVGVAGYRIDLAIVDPARPGRYVIGIECDGATYHRALTARDRDRIRQSVLERLGWKIYRIWSTDWFHNFSRAFQQLCDAIDQATVRSN